LIFEANSPGPARHTAAWFVLKQIGRYLTNAHKPWHSLQRWLKRTVPIFTLQLMKF